MGKRVADAPAASAPLPAVPRGLARARTPLGVFVAALVVAVVAAPIPTLTWQATVVTGVIGVVAVVLVASGRLARTGAARPVTVRAAAAWLVLAVVFTVLELVALFTGSRPEFPTISHLLGPEFVDSTVRLVGYIAWLCAGYWLVRR
ncbi:MAG: hypothetical protein ACRDUV_20520 [Pseudonocardiaceae bacterium]